MLNIKTNQMAACTVNRTTGNVVEVGSVEFISASPSFVVDYDYNHLRFEDAAWHVGVNIHTRSRVDINNEVSTEYLVSQLSINDDVNFYIEPQKEYYFTWGASRFKLTRNDVLHYREQDTFILRSEHKLIPTTHAVGNRKCLVNINGINHTYELPHTFLKPFPQNMRDSMITFYNEANQRVSVGFAEGHESYLEYLYDNQNYYPHEGSNTWVWEIVIKQTGHVIRYIEIKYGSRGHWRIEIPDEISQAIRRLPTDRGIKLRFASAQSPIRLIESPPTIASDYLSKQVLQYATKILSATYSPDGLTGYFQLNNRCYTSVYHNGVQLTDQLLTTEDGRFTVSFPDNVHKGSTISIRTSTTWPDTASYNFELTVSDTIAPDPVSATLFTKDRIIGTGTVGDTVYAERDGVVIGTTTVMASGEFIMDMNEGIILSDNEIISLYTRDDAGNTSVHEVNEISVANTTEGIFSPSMGNDAFAFKLH